VKNTLALVVAALAVVAAGCGGGGEKEAASGATGGGNFKVGLVTDLGGLNDRGFNALAYKGLKRAEKQLGIPTRVVQSRSTQEYVPNLSALARQGYNLVIGVGFTEIQAMDEVSSKFPNSHFAIVDVSYKDMKKHPSNLHGLLFREEQTGYLAGYAAALAAKARGANVVSSVGGQSQPPVNRFIAGFQAGAKKAVPGIRTLNGYSQDFSVQAKCKELALNQIAAGSVAVFQVAGGCGLGALDAAREKGVWGIGVDADQSFLGPHVLTSATKGVDQAVFLAIKDAKAGDDGGGTDTVYGLGQNGVGLGKFSPKAPAGLPAKVRAIERQIIDGKIKNIPTEVGT
jgi:basic membrane protein A and related proteins